MKGIEIFVQRLLDKTFTTASLKLVSDALEMLSSKKAFKNHANAIVEDETLTFRQKKTQLLHLIDSAEVEILSKFFNEELTDSTLWLFSKSKIDYFDAFVREFQRSTETLSVVFLITAISLRADELKKITQDLEKSFGYKVILNHQIDPKIVAGAKVRIQNMVFDYSLKSKFHQFQAQWLSQLEKTEKLLS